MVRLKRKWNSDTCYSMDEVLKHYAKWNKPDMEGQILYDFIDMKYLGKSDS